LLRLPFLAFLAAALCAGTIAASAADERPAGSTPVISSIEAIAAPSAEVPFGEPIAFQRNIATSPPRPGINVVLAGEMIPYSFVNNALTSHFASWPTPSGNLYITAPLFRQNIFLLEEHREMAGSAHASCEKSILQPDAHCASFGSERFSAREWVNEQRGGIRLGGSPIYLAAAVFYRETNYGLVDIVSAGYGAEVLPNFRRTTSLFAHLYYYPNVNNEDQITDPVTHKFVQLREGMARYEIGITKKVGHSRQYVEAALDGSSEWKLVNYPNNSTKVKIVLGSGFRF